MVSARSFSSSRGPEMARRSCRLCSEICRVLAVIDRSGRRTRPATSQPSAIETTVMIASAIPDWTSSWWRSSARRSSAAAKAFWAMLWTRWATSGSVDSRIGSPPATIRLTPVALRKRT